MRLQFPGLDDCRDSLIVESDGKEVLNLKDIFAAYQEVQDIGGLCKPDGTSDEFWARVENWLCVKTGLPSLPRAWCWAVVESIFDAAKELKKKLGRPEPQ